MVTRNSCCFSLAALLLMAGTPALGDDIRPESKARPFADERCIEQCDTESDQCMQEAEGDTGKMEACDDKYSQCLRACDQR